MTRPTCECFSLVGRRALVTGASRGIGRACALGLAGAGADVALVARSEEDLKKVATEIEATGQKAFVRRADLADPEECGAVVADAEGAIHDDRLARHEPAWNTDDTVYFKSMAADPFHVPRDGKFRISCNFEEPLGAPLSIARLTLRRNVRTVPLWVMAFGMAMAIAGCLGIVALRESAKARSAQ